MIEGLYPITLSRKLDDIHSGGFSKSEEHLLGFNDGDLNFTYTQLHELVTLHRKNFSHNLGTYIKRLETNSRYIQKTNTVFLHNDTHIGDFVVFDDSKGPIVVEQGVTIKPFSYLAGPLRIDEHATINTHSNISGSYIGKYSKAGGEIANSVIESYSNKGHHGYLGDSYVGSWVNIGGGASTSNLKNTYGEITMNGIKTGEQFLGSVIADHAKIAGNALIHCGKVIGLSAHAYGTITEDVPSFTNYLSKENCILLPLDISEKIAERMYARRGIPFTEADKKVLSYAYTQTAQLRKNAGVTEGKLSF